MAGRQLLFCLGLSVLAAASARTINGLDRGSCYNDDIPMCARSRDNGMYFLFSNECELRKAQRGNLMGAPLYDVTLRHCFPNCDFHCSNGYQPACGVSASSGERRTFRNRCEMARTSCLSQSDWAVHRWGVCPKASREQTSPHVGNVGKYKRPLPVPCTRIYRPVCAAYAGVKSTFSNECLVNAENIKTQRNWRIVSEGLCGEDSTKMKHNRKYKPRAKPKLETETEAEAEPDRAKRSHSKKSNQVEDFQIPEDAVQIYAPSTFHTQFISNAGTMEKSYSLPARKPYVVSAPKLRRVHGSATTRGGIGIAAKSSTRPCVFSNEPVCGSFNGERRTFPTVCALMEYSQSIGNAWSIVHDGPCRRCDKPCPSVYQPVCASRNGTHHTVINECYLERVRCKDPRTVWKIIHKGECAKARGTMKPKAAATERGLIPRMLYASSRRLSITTPGKPLASQATTKAPTNPYKPRQQFRKSFRPTPAAISQEFNNRKIRKIELATAGFGPIDRSIENDSDASLWSSNDNWLVRQTLDNVKGYFSKKPATFKKAHSEKYPPYYWVKPIESSTQSDSIGATTISTTTASPMPPTLSIASAELLNLDIGNAANLYEDPQMLLKLTTAPATTSTTATPEPIESTTATPPSTTVATNPPSTTVAPATMSTSSEAWEETTSEETTAGVAETSATTAASVSTDAATSSATIAEDLSSTEARSSASTSTEASSESSTTTQSSDYTAEEPLSESSGQTSIYGLDKNSLIMRLLRARTNQNVFI
ncbi:mucin-5AC [Drosophila subobscura]|uniref:mucin-5AC n=1 Tax=Drosophila subobscura TaxID=7241 RepID=UPI00155B2F3F|nr:mucin-5AC [Drosophila subobscura]